MKLQLKKLPDQQTIEIEVPEDATCADLKSAIQQAHSDFDVAWQKVIFNGRIVPDDVRLEAQGIKDGTQSLVLVVRNPDAAPISSTPPSSIPVVAASGSVATPSVSASVPTPAAATSPSTASTPAPPTEATTTTTPPAFTPSDEALSSLLAMGFEQEQIVRALRLSGNNLQNACDLLLSGAPLPEQTTPQAASGGGAAAAATGGGGGGGSATTEQLDPQQEASDLMQDLVQRMDQSTTDPAAQFEWVIQQPQFQRIRTLMQSRPEMFASLLTQLGSTSPQLHELISQNQAEFLEWLNDEESAGVGRGSGGGGGVQMSQQDETSIVRLMELGFGREAVRQAYLACGKNEQMAANYLFENS